MIKGSYGRNQQESFPSISHQNLDMFNGMDFQCLVGGGVWFLLFFFYYYFNTENISKFRIK